MNTSQNISITQKGCALVADLELLFDQLKENQKEINKLYEVQKQLRVEADKKLRCLSKVTVS